MDLKKQLTRGHQEEIKKVLGDDLYAQMTNSASIEPIKPSEGVITPNMSRISPHSNPRTRTKNLDNLYKQRSELQEKQIMSNTVNSHNVTNNYGGGNNTPAILQKPEDKLKSLKQFQKGY